MRSTREALIRRRHLRPPHTGGEPLVRPARGPVFAFLGIPRESSRAEEGGAVSGPSATGSHPKAANAIPSEHLRQRAGDRAALWKWIVVVLLTVSWLLVVFLGFLCGGGIVCTGGA